MIASAVEQSTHGKCALKILGWKQTVHRPPHIRFHIASHQWQLSGHLEDSLNGWNEARSGTAAHGAESGPSAVWIAVGEELSLQPVVTREVCLHRLMLPVTTPQIATVASAGACNVGKGLFAKASGSTGSAVQTLRLRRPSMSTMTTSPAAGVTERSTTAMLPSKSPA